MKIRCLHMYIKDNIRCHNDSTAKPELGYLYFNKINICSVEKFVLQVCITVILVYIGLK